MPECGLTIGQPTFPAWGEEAKAWVYFPGRGDWAPRDPPSWDSASKKWLAAVLGIGKKMRKGWHTWGRASSDVWLGLVNKCGPGVCRPERWAQARQTAESLESTGEHEGRWRTHQISTRGETL